MVLLTGNPCIKDGVIQNKRFFAYPDDKTKFIQCNAWGGAYMVSCPEGYEFSQEVSTCVMKSMQDYGGYENMVQGNYNEVMEGNGQTMNGYNPSLVSTNQVDNAAYQPDEIHILPFPNNGPMTNNDMNGEQKPMYGESDGQYMDVNGEYMKADDMQEDTNGEMEQVMPMPIMAETATPAPMHFGGIKTGTLYGFMPMYGYMKSGDSVPSRHPASSIPCSMTKLMYMPHYRNPRMYYECIQGRYQTKTCSMNELWDQQSQRCRSIMSPTTEAPAPTTVPPTQPGSTGGKKSYVSSPCLNPAVKFLPYPSDDRRYVVCHTKYSWEIRWCGEGEIWVHQLAQCIDLNSFISTTNKQDQTNPTPPVTTPTTADPNGMNAYHQLCKESDSFYHAFTPDETKYIQCDEFKNAYLRECGPNKVWDDTIKTCVGRNEIPDAKKSTTGSTLPTTTTAKPMVSSNTTTGNNSKPTDSDSTIITFSTSIQTVGGDEEDNIDTERVNINIPGVLNDQPGDLSSGQYHPCPFGTLLDPSTGECLWQLEDYHLGPNCAPGFLWDTREMRCIEAVQAGSSSNNGINALIPAADLIPDEGRQVGPADPRESQSDSRDEPLGNPCIMGTGYYHPHPRSKAHYIQCDQVGNMHVMPCPTGLVWSQRILNCVPLWMMG